MVAEGSEIVGDFLSVVTTRADEARLVYSDGGHGGFKLGQNLLEFGGLFLGGRDRDGLDVGRGELVEGGVFLEGDRSLASVAYETKEIR